MGIKFEQSTSGSKPTYDSDGINDLPSVNLDGSNDFLASQSFDVNLNPQEFTIFVVFRESSSATYRSVLATRNTNNSSYFRGFILYSNPGADNVYHLQYGTGSSWGGSTATAVGSDEVILATLTMDSASGSAIYVNGGSSDDTDASVMSPNTLEKFYIGALIGGAGDSPSSFFPGRYGEIIMFSRNLKAAERQSVETYLLKKWGLSAS